MLLLAVADEIVVKTAILWRAFITPDEAPKVYGKTARIFLWRTFSYISGKKDRACKKRQATD